MKYNPHDYQIYAINFIKEHPIAAILLDMGMGKTSIVLAALNDLMFDSFEVTKVLIIAPLVVIGVAIYHSTRRGEDCHGYPYNCPTCRHAAECIIEIGRKKDDA